jgi:FdhE protein
MLDTPLANSPDAVCQALERLEKERPHLKPILEAVGGLLRARAELAEQVSGMEPPDGESGEIDPARFAAGVPIAPRSEMHFESSMVRRILGRVLAVMAEGLPAVRPVAETIRSALCDSALMVDLLGAVMAGQVLRLTTAARDMGVPMDILHIVLEETARPLAIAQARGIAPRVSAMPWAKGYCPVCGSPPEMGVITADGGRRLLVCSFCCHCWLYPRTACPFCSSSSEGPLEFYYIEGQEAERGEGCGTCKRYLPVFDIRQAVSFTPDVAAVGLLALEMLLQEKGFSRGADSWLVREAINFSRSSAAPRDSAPAPH